MHPSLTIKSRKKHLPHNNSERPEVLTEGHSFLVSFDDWILLHQSGEQKGLGIKLKPDQDTDLLTDAIKDTPFIAIEAGPHTDGRIYSLAMELRKRFNFKNELRAIGVTPDNFEMLSECGIDTFVVADTIEIGSDIISANIDLFGIPSVYQSSAV